MSGAAWHRRHTAGWWAVALWLALTAVIARATPDPLIAARAAFQDGLYDVAQRLLEPVVAAAARADRLSAADEDAVVLLARAQYEQRRYDDALATLAPPRSGWLRRAPARPAFVFWRAAALHAAGRHQEALNESADFETRFPGAELAPAVMRLRAWCLWRMNRRADALALFERFDRQHGAHPETDINRLEWARALREGGQTNAALAVLDLMAAREGGTPEVQQARLERGLLLRDLGRPDEALVRLTSVFDAGEVSPDRRALAGYAIAAIHAERGDQTRRIARLEAALALPVSPGVRARGELDLGRAHLDAGGTETGLDLIRGALERVPAGPAASAAQLDIARTLLGLGRAEEAAAAYQAHLEAFTNQADQAVAMEGRGHALLALGRPAEAAAAFTRAATLQPEVVAAARAGLKAADAWFANGQYERARELYGRGLTEAALAPQHSYLELQQAECLARAGATQEAATAFAELAVRYPGSETAERAHLRRGALLAATGQWPAALEAYEAALGGVIADPVRRREALRGRALARYRLLRFADALGDWESLRNETADPALAEEAAYMHALCLYWMGRDEEATAAARVFIAAHPDSDWTPRLTYWLGRTEFNRGAFGAAESAFLDHVARRPTHPLAAEALYWAGIAAARAQEFARAVETLGRVAREYPGSPRLPDVRFAQADALSQMGRYAEAIVLFDDVIANFPDSPLVTAAWGRKGDCQFSMGGETAARYEESIESYRRVTAAPGAPLDLTLQADYKIGRSLEKLNRTDAALEQYYKRVIVRFLAERAQGAWPGESTAVWFVKAALNACEILERRGDWRRAAALLQRVTEANVPGAGDLADRLSRIRAEHWWLFAP